MFNGIITHTGKITKIQKSKKNCVIEVLSSMKLKKNEIGSSIACSGACLTLETFKKNKSKFYLTKETLSKTIFRKSKKGDIINLEKSLKFGNRISGHFVQGHVDTTSYVKKISIVGKSWVINFFLSKLYKKYIVEKGSVTINGISLTIAKILKNGFQISVVPHTLKLTNLSKIRENDIVNIEFDVLGKYIKNFINHE
jgi:riboflavin synthase